MIVSVNSLALLSRSGRTGETPMRPLFGEVVSRIVESGTTGMELRAYVTSADNWAVNGFALHRLRVHERCIAGQTGHG